MPILAMGELGRTAYSHSIITALLKSRQSRPMLALYRSTALETKRRIVHAQNTLPPVLIFVS